MARPRRQILDDYAWDRLDDLTDCGGVITRSQVTAVNDAEIQILATVEFDFLTFHVLEVVEVRRGRAHRRKYSYGCIDDGENVFRYDRDPVSHPRMPEHKHVGPNERRSRTAAVRLRDALNEVYEELDRRWKE